MMNYYLFAQRRLPALLVVLMSFLAAGPAAGQGTTATLRGFVTDAETGRPLIGANVLLRGLGATEQRRFGTAVGSEGYYTIDGLPTGRYILRITYVGYRSFRDTLRLEQGLVTRSVELRVGEMELEEITVRAERQAGAADLEAGLQTIRPADLARVPTPAAVGDLATYLKTLPGVVSLGDRGGQLYVRGGAATQNLVLMDGMLIYRPFHIIGFFSVFPENLISSVEFYAGGFPARYAGRLSAVLDVQMRGGNHEHYAAAVGISPLAASVQVEGPVERGASSFLISVRRSLIESVSPFLLGREQRLFFSEQFAKYQRVYDLGRCSLTGFHSYDRGTIDPDRSTVFKWSNYALGGRCLIAPPSSSLLVELRAGFSGMTNSIGAPGQPERSSSIWRIHNRVDLTIPLQGDTQLRIGFHVAEGHFPSYDFGNRFKGIRTSDEFFITSGFYGGARLLLLDDRLTLAPSLSVNGTFGETPLLGPRLRASWRPWGTPAQELSAAVGLYHQFIQGLRDERSAGAAFTAWVQTPFPGQPAEAVHAILGWHQDVGPVSFSAEGYYKWVSALPVPIWSNRARFTTELDLADGTIYGFDTRVEYRRGRFYAYAGYQYGWTRYTMQDGLLGEALGGTVQSYHPPHDRRHSLDVVAQAELGWATASLSWQYGSGRPYTPAAGFDSFFDLRRHPDVRYEFGEPRFLFKAPYRGRLPAYHRLDVSLERTFEWSAVGLTAQIGAINVYNRPNVFYYDLFTFERVDQLPLIPYLSLLIETR